MREEAKVRRQGEIIEKLTGKGATVKYNRSRLTVYRRGKYAGWVSRRECNSLKAESKVRIRKVFKGADKGRYTVRFKRTILEKPVIVKVGKMKHGEKRTWKIIMHTRTQKRFVYRQFKKGKIPVSKSNYWQKMTKLSGKFKLLNMKTASIRKIGS